MGALSTLACSVLFPIADDAASGKLDGSVGDSATQDAVSEAADALGVDAARFTCPPASAGPALVAVEGYCVDSRKVTVAEFEGFVEAGVARQNAPAECRTKTSFELVPDYDGGRAPPNFPALVDYCDAVAFCEWAGKRLCGAIDGGREREGGTSDPTTSQWLRACVGPQNFTYPYGNVQAPDACASSAFLPGARYTALAPADSNPGCEGAYPGIFDMVGNGDEWGDDCYDAGFQTACLWRGRAQCRDFVYAHSLAAGTFRCCAP